MAKIIDEEYGGIVPKKYNELISLAGVGNKSAKVYLVERFNENYFPVDTHVARVSKRLLIVNEDDPVEKIEKKLEVFFKKKDLGKIHQKFVIHGRYTCKARNPKCDICLLKNECFYFKSKACQ